VKIWEIKKGRRTFTNCDLDMHNQIRVRLKMKNCNHFFFRFKNVGSKTFNFCE